MGLEIDLSKANLGSSGILEFVAMATKDDLDVTRMRRSLGREGAKMQGADI